MTTLGILGAGSMGSGIAQVAATAGHEVFLFDTNPDALQKASENLQKILNRLVEKGKIGPGTATAIFGRIYFIDSMKTFADCGMVIEAIIENLEIKKKVFTELESIVS